MKIDLYQSIDTNLSHLYQSFLLYWTILLLSVIIWSFTGFLFFKSSKNLEYVVNNLSISIIVYSSCLFESYKSQGLAKHK
jgi:hypothetical protein